MEELGANRVVGPGIGDDKDEDKFETGFSLWMPEWCEVVHAPPDPTENDPPADIFKFTPMTARDVPSSGGLLPPPGTKWLYGHGLYSYGCRLQAQSGYMVMAYIVMAAASRHKVVIWLWPI